MFIEIQVIINDFTMISIKFIFALSIPCFFFLGVINWNLLGLACKIFLLNHIKTWFSCCVLDFQILLGFFLHKLRECFNYIFQKKSLHILKNCNSSWIKVLNRSNPKIDFLRKFSLLLWEESISTCCLCDVK